MRVSKAESLVSTRANPAFVSVRSCVIASRMFCSVGASWRGGGLLLNEAFVSAVILMCWQLKVDEVVNSLQGTDNIYEGLDLFSPSIYMVLIKISLKSKITLDISYVNIENHVS